MYKKQKENVKACHVFSHRFCHSHPPKASITAYDQVLVHFTSVGRDNLAGWGDRGFVISYVALDSSHCEYWFPNQDCHSPFQHMMCGTVFPKGILISTISA